MLFFVGNDGSGRSWDIQSVSEYEISLNNAFNASLDISGIYNYSAGVLETYSTAQSGAGTNSYGLNIIIDNYTRPNPFPYIVSTTNSTVADTITLDQVNSGDLIVLLLENGGASTTAPAGFTKIVSSETGNPYMAVATKVATGSENVLTAPSFVIFCTVNNNNQTVTTPPPDWTLIEVADSSGKGGYLYGRYYPTSGSTGSVSATWTGTPVNAVLVSFIV